MISDREAVAMLFALIFLVVLFIAFFEISTNANHSQAASESASVIQHFSLILRLDPAGEIV